MKKNPVKRMLKDGEPAFGLWLSLSDILSARQLARAGFGWLTLDMEHQSIDIERASILFALISDGGGVPLARIASSEYATIKAVLDAGAWGIIVPMVESAQQAADVVAAAKFPPEGNRSVGGQTHCLNFAATRNEYVAKANSEILVVPQIESPAGVKNVVEICQVDGVDAVFVGPADLGARIPIGDAAEKERAFESAIATVIDAGKQTQTPTGMFCPNVETALRRRRQGMQLLSVGTDAGILNAAAAKIVAEFQGDA